MFVFAFYFGQAVRGTVSIDGVHHVLVLTESRGSVTVTSPTLPSSYFTTPEFAPISVILARAYVLANMGVRSKLIFVREN